MTNIDGYKSLGAHWIALYVNFSIMTYFDNFWHEHIPKGIKKSIKNKNIITKTFRIQACYSIMCGCYCIEFIDVILEGKRLDYTISFSPNEYWNNDCIVQNCFQ